MAGRPKGDPVLMLEAAGMMAELANTLIKVSSTTEVIMPAPAFTGPGRASHDEAFLGASGDAQRAAAKLTAESLQLGRDAKTLYDEQQRWDREHPDGSSYGVCR